MSRCVRVDVDLPLSERRWPDYVRIEVNKATGAKRIYVWLPDRRRIDPMAPALIIRKAAKRRAAGLPLAPEDERAVVPHTGPATAAESSPPPT